MASSPACFAAFTRILAAEYSDPALMDVHRLTVDTYAVQHPGDPRDRRCVQSVGLHLARLCLQLSEELASEAANRAMLVLGRAKAELVPLAPPARFRVRASDVAPHAGTPAHAGRVRDWAVATWEDWSAHHAYIRAWAERHRG